MLSYLTPIVVLTVQSPGLVVSTEGGLIVTLIGVGTVKPSGYSNNSLKNLRESFFYPYFSSGLKFSYAIFYSYNLFLKSDKSLGTVTGV